MGELQRSAMSFRRQGSSGLVWDDKFLSELDKITQQQELEKNNNNNNNNNNHQQDQQQNPVKDESKLSVAVGSTSTIERSRSNGGGRAFRTGKVSPAIEPPSPRVSACGICSAFGKREKKHRRRPKSAHRVN